MRSKMKYYNIEKGKFISRPNRFIAKVETALGEEICHVKNTGRLSELLSEGITVYLERNNSSKRKTALDLIAVEKNGRIVNIDSQAPNTAVYEWIKSGGLLGGIDVLKREVTYKKSRIDIYAEKEDRKIFAEVKGVTLFDGDTALFPDAPTERGVKHLEHLAEAVSEGYEAYILFVIQSKGPSAFSPNYKTHREFGEKLREVSLKGVKIVAVDTICDENSMEISDYLDVIL